jgi:hypothetical protein
MHVALLVSGALIVLAAVLAALVPAHAMAPGTEVD